MLARLALARASAAPAWPGTPARQYASKGSRGPSAGVDTDNEPASAADAADGAAGAVPAPTLAELEAGADAEWVTQHQIVHFASENTPKQEEAKAELAERAAEADRDAPRDALLERNLGFPADYDVFMNNMLRVADNAKAAERGALLADLAAHAAVVNSPDFQQRLQQVERKPVVSPGAPGFDAFHAAEQDPVYPGEACVYQTQRHWNEEPTQHVRPDQPQRYSCMFEEFRSGFIDPR